MPIRKNPLPSLDRLKELLRYDPETGHFRWRVKGGRRKIGGIAGWINTTGARQIEIEGRIYVAHRLAWLYMTGREPADEIDHKDGIPDNNIWTNLREATHSENCCNRVGKNSSGFKGVWWHEVAGKWQTQVKLGGKIVWKRKFNNAKEAHLAYVAKAKEIHGEFARVE